MMTDETRAALEAGIANIVRDLQESAARQVLARVANASNGTGALRQGFEELRRQLPGCEEKLIALHLDLGVRDATAISSRIADEFRNRKGGVAFGFAGWMTSNVTLAEFLSATQTATLVLFTRRTIGPARISGSEPTARAIRVLSSGQS